MKTLKDFIVRFKEETPYDYSTAAHLPRVNAMYLKSIYLTAGKTELFGWSKDIELDEEDISEQTRLVLNKPLSEIVIGVYHTAVMFPGWHYVQFPHSPYDWFVWEIRKHVEGSFGITKTAWDESAFNRLPHYHRGFFLEEADAVAAKLWIDSQK